MLEDFVHCHFQSSIIHYYWINNRIYDSYLLWKNSDFAQNTKKLSMLKDFVLFSKKMLAF